MTTHRVLGLQSRVSTLLVLILVNFFQQFRSCRIRMVFIFFANLPNFLRILYIPTSSSDYVSVVNRVRVSVCNFGV